MKWFLLFAIKSYQKILSFDHGIPKVLFPNGFCRFYPTCSQYGYNSIQRFGIFKGFWLVFIRILKCNPFSKGGIDPVPEEKQRI